MSNVITGLLITAILLSGVMMLSQAGIVSLRQTVDAWDGLQTRQSAILLTRIEVTNTQINESQVHLTIRNTGQVPIRSFSAWDVFVQYYQTSGAYHVKRLTYTTENPPGNDQWTVEGIYTDANATTAEVFQPDILDPGEYVLLYLKLVYPPRATPPNNGVIAVPNGITVSTPF